MPLSTVTLLHDANVKPDTAILRAVADRIVPPDDGTPGASASGAFDYLWKQLSPGGDLVDLIEDYQAALIEIPLLAERLCGETNFAGLVPNLQDAVLRAFEKQNPRFFARMVEHVQEGFYTSQAAFDMIGWKVTG